MVAIISLYAKPTGNKNLTLGNLNFCRVFIADILLADTYIITAFGCVVNNWFIERGEKVRNLKELREAKGMTQHDVARKLDVTDVAISRWECGRSNPMSKNRDRLADLYGVSRKSIDKVLPPLKTRKRMKEET